MPKEKGGRRRNGDMLRTASTVKETVSNLDGVVDRVGASVVVDLPQTEAHDGHIIAATQLDVGGRHSGDEARGVTGFLGEYRHWWEMGVLLRAGKEKRLKGA